MEAQVLKQMQRSNGAVQCNRRLDVACEVVGEEWDYSSGSPCDGHVGCIGEDPAMCEYSYFIPCNYFCGLFLPEVRS
ncbi:MAG: hypothetical protein JSW03_02420 [Candidatus Eiseniibacteriota bacterium]|nr:MAG: hypothetical protein JSW03_02420 [Candidatus Eisenbacteria bacterium]